MQPQALRSSCHPNDGKGPPPRKTPMQQPRAASKPPKPRSRNEQLAYDQQLVERIRRGDRQAFAEIYHDYAPSLLERILRMLGGNMERAEDCLQQVFAQALQTIHHYKGTNVLHAWLNRLTTFVVMDEFRAKQSRKVYLKQFWWAITPRAKSAQAIPEELFVREEAKELVREALTRLNATKQITITLCDLEGYSLQEAAAELGVPEGTVASRLHHARNELRHHILQISQSNGLNAEDWLHVT